MSRLETFGMALVSHIHCL